MLIALKAEDRVYLAQNLCDLSVRDFDRRDFTLADNVPLWKVKNGCIMGNSDSLEDADLIRYETGFFRGETDFANLLEHSVPAMLEKLAAFRRLDKDGEIKSHFVIAQGNRGFHIYCKSVREELSDYFVFGSGYELAFSALDMSVGLPAEERIKRAYEAVEASLCMPAYPIALMDTKTQTLKIIEKRG